MIDAVNENPTIEEQTWHYQRDDLVTRLRKHSHGGMHVIGEEAASEIERLRGLLAEAVGNIAMLADHSSRSKVHQEACRFLERVRSQEKLV